MRSLEELALDGEPILRVGGGDLCRLLDISPAALTDLVKRELVFRLGHDAYDLKRSVTIYVTHLRGIAAGWGTGAKAEDLTAQRARLAKEQADEKAMKNALTRGELLEAEAVAREWAEVLRQVRARILSAPSRLRQDLALSAETTQAIDRELRAALEELGHDEA